MEHVRRICAHSPLLKKGVERGLITTFTIGSMMCKETLKKGFVIKEIVEEAEDSVLPVSSEAAQGCQFRSVSSGMAEIFYTNSKNETKQNNFHLILNLGPFRIFRLNFGRYVPVSFHIFRSALEKPLNQIEHYSI
jgi:hypothetical protein